MAIALSAHGSYFRALIKLPFPQKKKNLYYSKMQNLGSMHLHKIQYQKLVSKY